MNLGVAIPTRSNWKGLEEVLDHLSILDVARVVVYDNGHGSDEGKAVLATHGNVIKAVGWPFYRMWNHMWEAAANANLDAVAILNDDITLHDDSLEIAFRRFQQAPQVGLVGLNYNRPVSQGADPNAGYKKVNGSFRDGGIGGHAFLVRCSTWGIVPPIDERYNLWYGDDELFLQMKRSGFDLEIALGAPVDHATSTTAVQYPELMALTSADGELYRSKWG